VVSYALVIFLSSCAHLDRCRGVVGLRHDRDLQLGQASDQVIAAGETSPAWCATGTSVPVFIGA